MLNHSWNIVLKYFFQNWIPFYQHELILIPAWISKYVHKKVQDQIAHQFPYSNVCTIEVLKWKIQFYDTLYWACDNLSMLELKLIHVNKRGQRKQMICYCNHYTPMALFATIAFILCYKLYASLVAKFSQFWFYFLPGSYYILCCVIMQ